ncbi:prepilin peptidase [Deinococcus cellulosilyticus]|uniref:Prepilin peptidase n=1 Tax=Deinococcus cellulosilyticus (strain DSM 18568 / NBRC 106333 / KACC 11606 / 5516J-15) TaxID=1223518 RepID=A0A511N454_DEIC1|nr:prepilin peptidase [Deinococcus cellulosilyticus]GEM47659.1 prepilin peptidase [Deinococcus cellulosilyticus NBRC 106333 = KACC 11606]
MPYFYVVLFFVLGAFVGGHLNRLIHRIPRGEALGGPSHCLHESCKHPLGLSEQIPLISYLSQGGKCRHCGKRIPPRYFWVELFTAVSFAALAYAFPLDLHPVMTLLSCLIMAILVVFSGIDFEHRTIEFKHVLLLIPLGILTVWMGGLLYPDLKLPPVSNVLKATAMAAGGFVLANNYGSWIMRMFREPRYPEYPIGFMTVNIGALVGAAFGVWWGVGAALLAVALNLIFKRVVRIPDFLTLIGLLVVVVLSLENNYFRYPDAIFNALLSAGIVVLLQALYWSTQKLVDDDQYDPIAVGFGDVMLAALMGAFLGLAGLWKGLIVMGVLGIFFGIFSRVVFKEKQIPLAPFITAGILVTYVMHWY